MNEIRFNPQPKIEQKEFPKNGPTEPYKSGGKMGMIFKNLVKFLSVLILLILIFYAGRFVITNYFTSGNSLDNEGSYSAVFLSNGQVYFGRMVKNNQKEIVLTNVYYLQSVSQGGGQATTSPPSPGSLGPSFNLVKLGNELHGPTDELFINLNQVMFYEKLREDSQVVKSIKSQNQ